MSSATDYLGVGMAFPLSFSGTGGITTSEGVEHVNHSLRQILSTNLGERFMRPDFGSRLRGLLFMGNHDVYRALARNYIVSTIEKWEPRLKITEIEFIDSTDRHVLPIRIRYRIISSNVEGNLVYSLSTEA